MMARVRTSIACSLLLLLGACKTDDGGSGIIDRGVCDTLIECASDLAPESRDEFIATYGEGGTCWQNGPAQWAACRDACRDSLDAINLIGQATGQTCGTCSSDGDCSSLGAGASCEDGVCVGGEASDGESGGHEASEMGETGEDTADTDTPGCAYPVPEECLRFVDCVGAITPAQRAQVEAEYGENGSCWCGTQAEAQACFATCVSQLDAAIENYPTVAECHPSSCSLDELDPSQPYGPVVNGACPAWNGSPQLPLVEPFGLPGSVCAPPCSGIAQSCPDHTQTAADGTCYVVVNDTNYCVSRCYVDSVQLLPNSTQCQCGAICQPHGGPDAEGNLRGICTFE